jgi:hypothetical protein
MKRATQEIAFEARVLEWSAHGAAGELGAKHGGMTLTSEIFS